MGASKPKVINTKLNAMTIYNNPEGLAANFAALSILKLGYMAPIPIAIPDSPKERPTVVTIAMTNNNGVAFNIAAELIARHCPTINMGTKPTHALAKRNSSADRGAVRTNQKLLPSNETAEN